MRGENAQWGMLVVGILRTAGSNAFGVILHELSFRSGEAILAMFVDFLKDSVGFGVIAIGGGLVHFEGGTEPASAGLTKVEGSEEGGEIPMEEEVGGGESDAGEVDLVGDTARGWWL